MKLVAQSRPTERGVPAFIYHGFFGDSSEIADVPAEEGRYFLPLGQLQAHLDYLAGQGFRGCSVADYLAAPESRPDKTVVLTFDDGHISNYHGAWPLLRERGLRATFFVVAGWVGHHDRLNRRQLRELQGAGISVASHGLTHAPLSRLGTPDLDHELVRSKQTLEDILGVAVQHLAIPGGFFNAHVLERARKAGYECVCTSVPGLANREFAMRRLSVTRLTDVRQFSSLANQDPRELSKARVTYGALQGVKSVLGVNTYERLCNRLLRGKLAKDRQRSIAQGRRT